MLRFHTHAKPHPARSWHGFVAHAYCGGGRHSATNTLSEDPQLEERRMRLGTRVDDHIYNTRRNPEGVKEDAVKWQRVWAMKIRHKLTRKQFFRAIDQDNIPPPPCFDTSIDRLFTKHDQFRSYAERLYGWAVYDTGKEDELNPLRHSLERVLSYWNKHNPQRTMPTNPLPPAPAPAPASAPEPSATPPAPATAPVRLLAQQP